MVIISASDNSKLNDSSSPDSRGVENIPLRSLADNIITIQSNTEILNDLSGSVRSIESRLSHLENSVATSQKEVSELKPRVATVESESKMIKSNLSLLVEENVRSTSEFSLLKGRTMRIESRDTEKNLLLWNVPVNDEESAKKIFEKVITDGIGLNLDFEYSVVDINREKQFIKVEVARREAQILILKNARMLKNKSILGHFNIFVTDDAPQSVREVLRKLFAVRLTLLNSGVNCGDVWVTKSIPPLLCIRQCPTHSL